MPTKTKVKPTRQETKAAVEAQAPATSRRQTAEQKKRGDRNLEQRARQLKAWRPDADDSTNDPKLSLKDAVGEVFWIKSMKLINTREFGEQYLIKIIHVEDNGDTETDKVMWAEPGGSRDDLYEVIRKKPANADVAGPYTVEAVDRYRLIRLATEREMERAGIVPF